MDQSKSDPPTFSKSFIRSFIEIAELNHGLSIILPWLNIYYTEEPSVLLAE
jgi:hypothetical protein